MSTNVLCSCMRPAAAAARSHGWGGGVGVAVQLLFFMTLWGSQCFSTKGHNGFGAAVCIWLKSCLRNVCGRLVRWLSGKKYLPLICRLHQSLESTVKGENQLLKVVF